MKSRVFAVASMSLLLVVVLMPGAAVAADAQRFDPVNVRRAHPGLPEGLQIFDQVPGVCLDRPG